MKGMEKKEIVRYMSIGFLFFAIIGGVYLNSKWIFSLATLTLFFFIFRGIKTKVHFVNQKIEAHSNPWIFASEKKLMQLLNEKNFSKLWKFNLYSFPLTMTISVLVLAPLMLISIAFIIAGLTNLTTDPLIALVIIALGAVLFYLSNKLLDTTNLFLYDAITNIKYFSIAVINAKDKEYVKPLNFYLRSIKRLANEPKNHSKESLVNLHVLSNYIVEVFRIRSYTKSTRNKIIKIVTKALTNKEYTRITYMLKEVESIVKKDSPKKYKLLEDKFCLKFNLDSFSLAQLHQHFDSRYRKLLSNCGRWLVNNPSKVLVIIFIVVLLIALLTGSITLDQIANNAVELKPQNVI